MSALLRSAGYTANHASKPQALFVALFEVGTPLMTEQLSVYMDDGPAVLRPMSKPPVSTGGINTLCVSDGLFTKRTRCPWIFSL